MEWINIIVPVFTTFLGALLAYYFSQRASKKKLADSEAKQEEAQRKLELQKRLAFYEQMNLHLQASHDAFIDQCKIRNKLLKLLGYDLETFDWEKLEEVLVSAHPTLTSEQQNLFDLIRGITRSTLYSRNNEVLELLKAESQYFNELPEFKDLQGHLELWNAKFNSIFKTRNDYCLIYVGVNENKPFPTGIEQKVEDVIKELEAQK